MEYPKPIASIDELPKRYGGVEREQYWQQYWKDCGVYDYDPTRSRDEVYSVDTPPPTVSGALHIGHVYSYTHTDFSVRYQRMAGKHVFYPFGFDDNGLPSERLVERVTGKRAHEVGREEFIKLCKPILEQAAQALGHDAVVVGQQHCDAYRVTSTMSLVPLPGWASIRKTPPTTSARSLMMSNPRIPVGRLESRM